MDQIGGRFNNIFSTLPNLSKKGGFTFEEFSSKLFSLKSFSFKRTGDPHSGVNELNVNHVFGVLKI